MHARKKLHNHTEADISNKIVKQYLRAGSNKAVEIYNVTVHSQITKYKVLNLFITASDNIVSLFICRLRLERSSKFPDRVC